jgi:hypothetical protein
VNLVVDVPTPAYGALDRPSMCPGIHRAPVIRLEAETFCTSGDAHGFFGLDVAVASANPNAATSLVRIVDDPIHGKLVRIYQGDESTPYVDYRTDTCRTFEVSVRQHGSHTEGVHYMGATWPSTAILQRAGASWGPVSSTGARVERGQSPAALDTGAVASLFFVSQNPVTLTGVSATSVGDPPFPSWPKTLGAGARDAPVRPPINVTTRGYDEHPARAVKRCLRTGYGFTARVAWKQGINWDTRSPSTYLSS